MIGYEPGEHVGMPGTSLTCILSFDDPLTMSTLPDPTQGPRGALGVPLTPERSVAVDPTAVPLGSALWVDTSEPLSATPLRRLMMAQDTGSAITGAVRIDYFWGTGERAQQQAGRMMQPLRLWVLWPKG